MITRILHHSVNVEGQLAENVDFYSGLLGLAPERRPDIPGVDGAWFGVGDAQVHLVDAPEGDAPIRPAAAHVCLGVDDLDATIRTLERLGIPFERGAQGTVVQVWIVDPSGNVIELQQDPSIVPSTSSDI